VTGLALIIGLVWFFVAKNKKQRKAEIAENEDVAEQYRPMAELSTGPRHMRSELGSDTSVQAELPADNKREIGAT
jgi:hypothetical protein